MRGILRGGVLGLAMLASMPVYAAPAPEEPTMTFTFQREDYRKYGLGLYQVIHASGAITEGTADALKIFIQENHIEPGGEIYFNSATGNRIEGIRMGRYIRQFGLMTHIGDTDPSTPGACVSACSFAYLGGTFRFMNATATYGVHRFYRSQSQQEFTLEEAPTVSKVMTDYMRDMGVSTSLFRYMTISGKGDVVLIDKQTLRSLGVVNQGVTRSDWDMAKDEGVPFMLGDVQNYQGRHTLGIYCDRQYATLRGSVMRGVGVLQTPDPESLIHNTAENGVFLGDKRIAIQGDLAMSPKQVTYTFPISQDLAARMVAAPDLGVYFQPRGIIYYGGFSLPQTQDSKEMMKKFVNDCFATQIVKSDEPKP